MNNSGKLIQWINVSKQRCFGIAYDINQTEKFAEIGKLAYVKTNEKFEPITNEKGGHIIGLVDKRKVKFVGFTD